jgi:hypothetical protein
MDMKRLTSGFKEQAKIETVVTLYSRNCMVWVQSVAGRNWSPSWAKIRNHREAQPCKFNGLKSWSVLWRHFKTVIEHSYWTLCKIVTWVQPWELVAHIPHGVPTGMLYKHVTEILENCYGDHHLKAAFHSQLKRRTQFVGGFLQEPLTTWLTAPTLDYPNTY